MKLWLKLRAALWFLTVMLFLSVMFTASFYLTGWVYHQLGQTPSPLGAQLITSLGGLILTVLIVGAVSTLFKSKLRAGELKLFAPIIEALERIAKGDFSVRVDKFWGRHELDSGALVELVNSVNQMALQLDQMETMRQEFISNVSHELQSPLTSIRGFAQALQNNQMNDEERRHYLAIIEMESIRLSKLTDNLLKLAALEAEHPKFEPKPYGLDKQIRTLILACEPQWTDKKIEMDVALEEIAITADEDLLSQVWINLLHNSIKFTPEGGMICVRLYRLDNRVEFVIEDSGIGITEADKAHIFERFYKADKSRTRSNHSGSGLGLSIAKKIVEMHQGSITAESQSGMGTTFTVSLPPG